MCCGIIAYGSAAKLISLTNKYSWRNQEVSSDLLYNYIL
jgi:hypothetical protein